MSERAVVFPFSKVISALHSVGPTVRNAALSNGLPFSTPVVALLTAACYYAGSQLGFFLTPADTPISTFWPPNAILLAVFLLTSQRIWWVLALAVLPAHLAIQLKTGIPVLTALGWFVGNTGEALLGAVCIRLFKREKPLFESVHGVLIFLAFGVLLAPLVTSFVDAASAILIGKSGNYWMLWTTRLTSNMISVLTIVPTIVIFRARGSSWFRRANLARHFEAAVLAGAVVAVSLLVFSRVSAPGYTAALTYIPFLPLLWAALRFGSGGLSASMLGVALISSWNAMHGRGPFGASAMADYVLSLHILLAIFGLPLLLTAALMAERRSDEETLQNTRRDLIYVQEQERQRIARELRDDIVQRLALVGLSVDRFRTEAKASALSTLDQLYGEISRLFEDTLDLSHEVHPFIVEYLGLAKALIKLCRDTGTEEGMTIKCSVEDVPLNLPLSVCLRIFRIVKLALQNIQARQAKTAAVELKVGGGGILFRIADGGIGMDPHAGEGERLAYMREQILSLGGTLKIASVPNEGMAIEVSVPIIGMSS
jgi:integral membrane sensor domain MASE1